MGMGPIHLVRQREQEEAARQLQQQQQQMMAAAAAQPIPGVTGPTAPAVGGPPGGMIGGLMLEALRRANTGTAGTTYDPNMPIPRPGQPTSRQVTPVDFGGGISPRGLEYINQDIAGFNAQQPIPGMGVPQPQGGQGLPQQPMAPQMNAPGPYAQQAMQMAGLLGQQPQQPPPGGGLLGGPKRGFRIPGGK